MIEIDHRPSVVRFTAAGHPSIMGGAETLEASIEGALHAARHCAERASGGIAVELESLHRHVAHRVRHTAS